MKEASQEVTVIGLLIVSGMVEDICCLAVLFLNVV